MRLVAWNCNMGLHSKIDRLLSLRPDIAVIPECASPAILRDKAALFMPQHCEWIPGSGDQKGLGVLAFGDYTLERYAGIDLGLRFMLPLHVRGPVEFSLLATWAMNMSDSIKRTDPGPMLGALDRYREFLATGPAIVAGDFNNHFVFDKPNRACNHANTLVRMKELGLSSAYHHVTGEPAGKESRPTFYWYRDPNKPYHIDYCFVSKTWLPYVHGVTIGNREDWLGHSDHMPIIVDLQLP